MMKNCELCGGAAGIYCESDQASLCWDCDRKVHGANFLVAKHTRSLLCHSCLQPTLWRASGQSLDPAVSVCDSCSSFDCKGEARTQESEEEYEEDEDNDDQEEEEEEVMEDSDDDGEKDAEDGENQVVPWSGDSSPSPPVVSSDSSSAGEDEVVYGIGGGSFRLKRMREDLAVYSDDDIGSSSSNLVSGASASGEAVTRALKQRRLGELNQSERNEDRGEETKSKSTAIVSSLKRLQKEMITNNGNEASSATVLEICRLSRDQNH